MPIFGWDMSHFDAPSIGSAVADGISFLTHKAGGDKNDTELGAWWSGVRGLDDRVLLGAYWVLYPGNPRYRAELFLSRLDDQCPGWRLRPFILQVDCEKWNGDAGTVPSRSEIAAFCDRLVERTPKLRPIVYAPKWVYGDRLAGLEYPLWASSYVDGSGGFRKLYPGDSSDRWNAYSGQVPAILQYSSSATIGGQSTCDANAYRGTLAELTALVAPGWTEDDMPTADEVADAVIERLDKAGIRNGRTVGGTLDALAVNSVATVGVLKTIASKDAVDEQALAAALAPAVAELVLAGLPADAPVTSEQLQAAIVGALRELAAPAA